MITLEQAIELATEAHDGQYRKSIKVFPVNEHTLKNHELTKLQQNNDSDFSICKEDGKYTMDIHLQLFIAKPYITHPLAVMEMMNTDEEKIVAVLHDVVEMCDGYYLCEFANTNERYLVKENENSIHLTLTKSIYDALVLLTHSKDVNYIRYIFKIKSNKLAVKVKIADMMHNMSETNNPKQKEKYLKALPILLKAL